MNHSFLHTKQACPPPQPRSRRVHPDRKWTGSNLHGGKLEHARREISNGYRQRSPIRHEKNNRFVCDCCCSGYGGDCLCRRKWFCSSWDIVIFCRYWIRGPALSSACGWIVWWQISWDDFGIAVGGISSVGACLFNTFEYHERPEEGFGAICALFVWPCNYCWKVVTKEEL